jgi:hypothetical protein
LVAATGTDIRTVREPSTYANNTSGDRADINGLG